MKIAIQAADLDSSRIDGTRVYLLNVLKYFGKISESDEFLIYHRKDFNSELVPAKFSNYIVKRIYSPLLWTQTKFAWDIQKDKADVLWMPMHNVPFFRNKKMKTVVTIHDLAFKRFPKTFPKKDLFKLNLLTNLAIKKADKIIAVSKSTKKDILKFYPQINPDNIQVIYHGFDKKLFEKNLSKDESNDVLSKFKIQNSKFMLYVGAIQPRKNLKTLVKAFEILRNSDKDNDQKLVIAGGKAWSWEETMDVIEKSSQKENIILTDRVSFDDLAVIYKNASVFVFPSLYEGFGIPVLEAFASEIPVIAARNSSLEEVGGDAAEYFESLDENELMEAIKKVLNNDEIQRGMVGKGKEQLKKFSWEKCARETLEFIKK